MKNDDCIAIPHDFDGKPVYIGDEMVNQGGWRFSVVGVGWECGDALLFSKLGNEYRCHLATSCRHFQAPTVVELLDEMYDALCNATMPGSSMNRTYDEIISEYAAKLQLKEDSND